MLFELIATAAAGFVAAGVVMVLRMLTGGRLPASLIPIAAGLAMLGYAVWSEQTWFERRVETLPQGFEVVKAVETTSWFRPWTYVMPMVERFMAVDLAGMRRNATVPEQALVELLLVGRWMPDALVPVVLDCAGNRRADVIDGAEMASDGQLIDADWRDLKDDDPLLQTVCQAM